jgi:hypothetical protein
MLSLKEDVAMCVTAICGDRFHIVRFTSESGHTLAHRTCPLCAKSGLMHCSMRGQVHPLKERLSPGSLRLQRIAPSVFHVPDYCHVDVLFGSQTAVAF